MAANPPVIPVPAAIAPPVPVAPAAVVFALTPGSLNANDIVDLSSKPGCDLYSKATTSITIPFDGSSKNINLFQSQLLRKAENTGWNSGTCDILTITDTNGDYRNVITEYGCVTEAHITTSAMTYIGTQTRQAQNNAMMVECLQASITEGCFYKISNEETKYTINNTKSAVLLFQLLMSKAIIDTRATTYQFRADLSSLDTYMSIIGSNIELFNLHVKNSREGLKARGETVDDLILKLFTGYKAAADSKFVEYIENKKELYLDGNDLDADELMILALNKYCMRKLNSAWGAPSTEQEQITALSSELQKLKEDKGKNNRSQKRVQNRNGNAPTNGGGDKEWAWKKIPPAEEEPESKTVKGRLYHWCVGHQAWTIHKPSACRLPNTLDNSEVKSATSKTAKSSSYKEALQTIMSSIEEDEEDIVDEE